MASITGSTSDLRIEKALNRAIELGEIGIAVAAYYRGKLIIDAVAGVADPETRRPADKRTIWSVFSVTKGVTAIAAHIQAERGFLKLDAPISRYWPEFAKHGKDGTTVEQALSHRAGIPQMPEGVTPELMADWTWMIEKIADFEPVFPPGKHNAYHILVWGWVIGEVVCRTDPKHRPFQTFVQEEICDPLDIHDFFLGVPDSELLRCAKLVGGNYFPVRESYNSCPRSVFPGSNVHNTKVVQQSVDPGAGAITTAAAVAKIFAMVANGGELDGKRLLSKERVASFSRLREGHDQPDEILQIPVWFGANGFWLGGEPTASDPQVGNHRDIVYSPGAGGSVAWADFRDRLAVAICHNNMDTPMVTTPERTFDPIVKAIREIIQDIDLKF